MIARDMTSALGALLDEEHTALMSGDFERISSLLDEKEGILKRLETTCETPADLLPLQEKFRRNHRLFDQSLAGLRAVAARLGALAQIRKSLSTYDENCQKESLTGSHQHRLEKRA